MGVVGRHADAWTEFWQDQGEASGCCAHAPEIQRPIQNHWSRFAKSLAPGSQVIDLGCGAGAAGRAIVAANPLTRVIGIDYAEVPASVDPRIDVYANSRMELLPFASASLDAAVSQFGFEYAVVEQAAREMARVLRPRAPVSLLVHHSGGRIACDSRIHLAALRTICGPEVETAFLSGDASALERQFSLIRRQLPHERIVDEAARGLTVQVQLDPAHRTQIWRAVKAALAPELAMLADLETAAVSAHSIRSWLRPLAGQFDLSAPTVMAMDGGQILCWVIDGIRRG